KPRGMPAAVGHGPEKRRKQCSPGCLPFFLRECTDGQAWDRGEEDRIGRAKILTEGPILRPSVCRWLAARERLGAACFMADHERTGRELSACQQYRTLLAVAEAIVTHRDLGALFHELAGRLRQIVRFDFLALVLLEAAGDTTRMHILETSGLRPDQWFTPIPVDATPSGMVLQTQQPLIVSRQDQLAR